MTKIYDAIALAEKEREGQDFSEPTAEPALPQRETRAEQSLQEKLFSVFQTIETMIPDKKCRVITFVAAHFEEGTSTLVREFAKLVANSLGRRVLILDADYGDGGHDRHFGVVFKGDCREVVSKQKELGDILQVVGKGSIALTVISLNGSTTTAMVTTPGFKNLIDDLREQFDLILIDSPAASGSSDAIALAAASDGVVLVLEAERTRRQVVQELKGRIEKGGGKLLGTILNKRRHCIPNFIYKRL